MPDQRLSNLCSQLLNQEGPGAFATHIARVLERVVARPDEVQSADDVWDRLSRCLFTGPLPAVIAARNQANASWNPHAIAACFSAALYPRRLSDAKEAALRLDAFLEAWQDGPVEPVLNDLLSLLSLRADTTPDAILDLTRALTWESGAKDVEDRQQRRLGALLYLSTCVPEQLQGMVRRCSSGDPALHAYRDPHFMVPPSHLLAAAAPPIADGSPSFDRMRRKIAELALPVQPEAAVDLESRVWKKRPRVIPPDQFSEPACEFWVRTRDKVNSGFPYFAFESKFTTWWLQCVQNFAHGVQGHVAIKGDTSVEPDLLSTRGLWRSLREGLRLLRTTFLAFDEEPSKNDAIWAGLREYYVEKLLDDSAEEQLAEIARRLGISPGNLSNRTYRIRDRMRAYLDARIRRLTNRAINELYRASDHQADAVHLTIASLVRPVLLEHSLLPHFLTHVFIHPKVDSANFKPWDAKRHMAELRFWFADTELKAAIRTGAKYGNRAERIFAGEMSRAPNLSALALSDLLVLAERIAMPAGLQFIEQWPKSRWTHYRDKYAAHWIAPVWYATFVEGFSNEEDLVRRLIVDAQDEFIVGQLFREMVKFQVPAGEGK